MKVRFFTLMFVFFALLTLVIASGSAAAQQPRKESLLNGLKVLMFPDQRSDRVWVRVRIHAGSAFDPQGREGLMQMLAANIFPSEAAKEYFSEDLGGSLEINTNYDYIQLEASAKPENLVPMLETLAGAISNPVIDKETTTRLQSEQTVKVKGLEADPFYVADRAAAKRLFGTFPYGRPMWGTEESLKKIDFADLLDARKRFLTADNAAVAISGSFNSSRALQAAKRFFGGWLKSDKRVPATFRQPEDPPAGMLTIATPVADRFAIRFALRGTARSAGDMAAADIYARILEARLRARVPAEDAANVFARSESFTLRGWILIGFGGTKNDIGSGSGKIDANDLMTKVLTEPVTEAEFVAARSAGAADWSKQPNEQFWLDAETYGTTPAADRAAFDTVTAAKVRDFAAWVSRQPAVTVLVNSPK